MELTEQQIERYSRHIILQDVGGKGQLKLSKAKVLLIGAGGLGSPAGLYLAAAGIGTIGLVDGDVVDLSNLQRQILHTTATVGQPKVESGKRTLTAINPEITVNAYHQLVDADNILSLISAYDVILDGSDNFTTRFLVNDACFFARKTLDLSEHVPLRRAIDHDQAACGLPLLPLPVSRASSGRVGAELPGSRRAGCAGRHDGYSPSLGSHQRDSRHR